MREVPADSSHTDDGEPDKPESNLSKSTPPVSEDLTTTDFSKRKSRPVKISAQPGEGTVSERTSPPLVSAQGGRAPEADTLPHTNGGEHSIRFDLRRDEVVHGSRPGDRYIKQVRDVGPFKLKGRGLLAASLATDQPRSAWGRRFSWLKRLLIGLPTSTAHSIHERLTNVKALAVLSSDALSSVAYATEEVLRVLLLAGAGAIASITLPIGLAVIILLAIVAVSYRQTIAAYPRGGGSYIVAKDNLGTFPGLTAAASILIDYTMTVAVSISAGIAALYSLFPEIRPIRVEICVVVIVLVTIINLRGVREAGNIFAVPTYLFIAGILGMIIFGLLRLFFGVAGQPVYTPPEEVIPYGTQAISLFLILRAFTQGCTALTGVEAIADGVPAFKPPEAKNARTTLAIMAVTAISMFAGITFLAAQLQIIPSHQETVLSQIARTVFPPIFGANPMWFYIQVATALILVLAANTAFADFPRLSYFLARDRFMPRQYAFRGDKLAFSWGIITLAVLACILVVAFDGDTTALIPLYTVGVFNSFTLSQAGMVVRWWRTKTPGWQRNLLINGAGALTTGLVLVVSAVTKFGDGAWIVVVLIPVLITMFLAINRHYRRVEREEQLEEVAVTSGPFKHTFIVPVARLNPITLMALRYARSLSANVTAVHVVEGEEEEEAETFNKEWHRLLPITDISLVIIESPYRSLIGPLLSYIDALDQQSPDDTITIILPESLPSKPWEYLLHNQSALRLKAALLFRPNTVVSDVPHVLGRSGGPIITGSRSVLTSIPWVSIIVFLVAVYLIYYFVFGR